MKQLFPDRLDHSPFSQALENTEYKKMSKDRQTRERGVIEKGRLEYTAHILSV